MRLFIAIHFTDGVKKQLLSVQNALRRQSTAGNFSRPENLHITMVFLGEIPPGRTNAVRSVMDGACSEPFSIKMEGVGKFRGGNGDTWWVGIRHNPLLSDLHRQLADGLKGSGFTIESRPFKPHLTLGREVVLKPDANILEIESFPDISDEVRSIQLMKSEHIQGKLIYTAIHEKIFRR